MPKNARSKMLTHEEIIDAALRLIQAQGLSGITMRAVATELGVTPMAMYHYFADKNELIRTVVGSISSSRQALRVDESGWEKCLRRYLLLTWEESTRYPGVGAYLIDQPSLGLTAEKLQEGIRFFEDAGFSPRTAPLVWSFTMTYIHGRISVDAHQTVMPGAARMAGLRARDFVEFGVDTLITGLRARLSAESEGQLPRSAGTNNSISKPSGS